MKYVPVYMEAFSYADEHGETEIFRASNKENMRCRKRLEELISDCYRDNCLDCKTILATANREFGKKRVRTVLANTIVCHSHDGRISAKNLAWANKIPLPEHDRIYWSMNQAHPGLVDLLVSAFRESEIRKKNENIR